MMTTRLSENGSGKMTSRLVLILFAFVVLMVGNVSAQDDSDSGTDLGGGITTRKDVSYYADLTLDIRDIDQQFASTGGSTAAMQIYISGKNSDPQGPTGARVALSHLSSKLANSGITSDPSPTYLFHLFGMADRSYDVTKLNENLSYADSFVRTSIMASQKTTAEAVNVLSVWMYCTQLLFECAQRCQKRVEADNPDIIDFNDSKYYDEFVALWIGSGQIPGSSEGYSLYSLAEKGDALFNVGDITSDDPEDTADEDAIESLVNKRIKLLYQEGASLLSAPTVCSKDTPESPKQLWNIANRIVTQMYIPLLQLLVNALVEQDTEAVRAYALAVIPQIAQCRPSTYKKLREQLLVSDVPSYDRTSSIVKELQSIFSCFGLTCDDVGVIRNDRAGIDLPICTAADNDAPMAQFQPGTDVLPIARIDHDILQLRILTSLGSFFNAKLLYSYGRNSPLQYYTASGSGVDATATEDAVGFYSLKDFALSTIQKKNAEPFYSMFVSYHNDPNYAHRIISETLEGLGKWGSKSTEQRSAIVVETSSFMVLYLHLIGQMYASINVCKKDSGGIAAVKNAGGEESLDEGYYELTHPWDEVAALVIGSLEGTQEGGSSDIQDGQLIWGLSTRRGYQFQTLNEDGYPKVNAQLEHLLFAGRGELDALDCSALEKTVERIRELTLIPILQSILRYAVLNEQHGNSESPSQDLALGETFALAVLPILQKTDPSSAQIIQENMIITSGVSPTRDGSQIVADAVGSAAISEGLRCSLLGSIAEAAPCSAAHGGSLLLRPIFILSSAVMTTMMFIL